MSEKDLEDKLIDLLSFVPQRSPKSVDSGEEVEDNAPLFSEAYLYHFLGKQEARIVLRLINSIAEETGNTRRELMKKARRRRNAGSSQ